MAHFTLAQFQAALSELVVRNGQQEWVYFPDFPFCRNNTPSGVRRKRFELLQWAEVFPLPKIRGYKC